MIIIPAIDICQNKVVRLKQGRFNQATIYSDDPLAVALKWQAQGAERIHIVDLDGAREGRLINLDIIRRITAELTVPVEFGGGIRTFEDIEQFLDYGIDRVVLGTRAVQDKTFLERVARRWPERIIVSVDCQNGLLTQQGWTETTDIKGTDFSRQLQDIGIKTLIYTDISKDGMMSGPNCAQLKEVLTVVDIPVIASGGISSTDHIRSLLELKKDGLMGCIIGRALYEKTITLEEAIAIVKQEKVP